MTDQPKTPGQAALAKYAQYPLGGEDWDAIAQAAIQASGLVEALERIVEVGTRSVTSRVGDMYDPHGYQENEIISEEAEIASDALAKLKGQSNG